jgi:predicted hydrocarbon binding protein
MNGLERARNLFHGIPPEKRHQIAINTLGNIICILSKYLIKTHGYDAMLTILRRELRELGKMDARMLMNLLDIAERGPESVKILINVAALILGIELGIKEGRVVAIRCPFAGIIKALNEPFLCNACEEYNSGILEEVMGENFKLEAFKRLTNEDEYCRYRIIKRFDQA